MLREVYHNTQKKTESEPVKPLLGVGLTNTQKEYPILNYGIKKRYDMYGTVC